jgi:parallel beta-helix repeat protein
MKYSLLSLLFACGDSGKEADTGSVTDDTGTTNTTLNPEDFESGCFMVDNENGFASFADAMLFAEEGSTIALVDCETDTHEEMLVIDKSITLIGTETWTLNAPVNETAITITAPNVTIQNMNVSSTRSAIFVDGGTQTTLTNINVFSAGNWAIKAVEATDLIIDIGRFENNGFGGINIIGGTATVSNVLMDFNTSVGIKIEDDGVVDVSNSTISNTAAADTTSPSDGIGIWVINGSTLTSSDNTLDGNFLSGVQGDGSDLSITNTTISNVVVAAVWTEPGFGDVMLNNVAITTSLNYGIVSQSSGAFSLIDTTIIGDAEIGPSTSAEEWADSGLTGTGIYVSATTIDMTNTEITGYNNCGIYAANDDTDASLTMSGVHIHDVGRQGAFVYGHEAVITDSVFENIFDLDAVQDLGVYEICYTVDRYGAFIGVVGDFTFENTTFAESASYGVSIVQGSTNMTGVTFNSNDCAGAMIFDSSGIIDSSTMLDPNGAYSNFGASVLGYNASYVQVTNSDLQPENNENNNNFHIFLYNTSGADFSGNTITGGYYGIYAQKSEVTVENNNFVDQNFYGYSTIVRYDTDPTDSANLLHTFSGNTYSTINSGVRGIYCESGGSVEASGESFSEHLGGNPIYATNCSTTLDDISMNNTNMGINVNGGNHEWDGLTFDGVATTDYTSGAIQIGICPSYICDTQTPVFVSLSNSTFSNIGNTYTDALRFSSSNPTDAPIEAYLDNLTIENIGGDGIYATNATLQISNLSTSAIKGEALNLYSGSTTTISDSSFGYGTRNAVSCFDCTMNMDNSTISNHDNEGIYMSSGDITLDTVTLSGNGVTNGKDSISILGGVLSGSNLNITGSGGHGISTSASAEASIDNSNIELSALSGLHLESTSNTITTTVLSSNTEYGMVCGVPENVSCAQIIHVNNLLGEQSGCDATCGIEPAPEPVPEEPTE